jgi:hypothetical protein
MRGGVKCMSCRLIGDDESWHRRGVIPELEKIYDARNDIAYKC